jgi:hypothetical protein
MTTPEAIAVPWILILVEPEADPIKVAIDLLDHGTWHVVEGGWMVTPSLDAREKAAARARRYRSKQRGNSSRSRDADRHAGVTQTSAENFEFGGEDHSLPTPKAREGVSDTPSPSRERDAETSRAVTRDASRDDVTEYADPQTWRMDPLTEEDRELGRQRVRELGDALRAERPR